MPRGRPRKTDPDAVLQTATQAFWKNGFDGTSMNDLANATGMAKPGLYATFGDKEALYAKALTNYVDALGVPMFEGLVNPTDRIEIVIRRYLEQVAAAALDRDCPGGCFVVNSLIECAHRGGPLEDLARSVDRKRRDILVRLMRKAIKNGELQEGSDPRALAEFYGAQTLALAVMARSGGKKKALDRMIDVAMTALPVQHK